MENDNENDEFRNVPFTALCEMARDVRKHTAELALACNFAREVGHNLSEKTEADLESLQKHALNVVKSIDEFFVAYKSRQN